MRKKQPIKFKRKMYKCYIDGKFYSTLKGYKNDLDKHLLDGSWEKAMTNNTTEFNRYLYNYKEMNGRFEPNLMSKSDELDIWTSNVINRIISKQKGDGID